MSIASQSPREPGAGFRTRRAARGLGWGLAVASLGLPGLLPGGLGAFDPLALAAWLALAAAPAGALAGARLALSCPAALTSALLPPGLWGLLLLAVAAAEPAEARLASPGAAGVAVAGLFALGMGLGALAPAQPARTAGLLALAALTLALLPTGGGTLAEPWPPAVTARLLDLSPLSFVLERGGLDWMRHPLVYEHAGSASIGPDLRLAGSGLLAPAVLIVVGCALVALSRAAQRMRTSPQH